jgi:hypothetical protein
MNTAAGSILRSRHEDLIAHAQFGVSALLEPDQSAKHMVSAAAALIAREFGPDEARRIMRIVGEAQEQAS